MRTRGKDVFSSFGGSNKSLGGRSASGKAGCNPDMVASHGCLKKSCYSCSGEHWMPVCNGGKTKKLFTHHSKPFSTKNRFSLLENDTSTDHQRVSRHFSKKSGNFGALNDKSRSKNYYDGKNYHNKSKTSKVKQNTSFVDVKSEKKKFFKQRHSKSLKCDVSKKKHNKSCFNQSSKKKIDYSLKVKRNLLCNQVDAGLFNKIQDVHKELNRLVKIKHPIRVMSTDPSDFKKDSSLSALVNLLDHLMNVGLSN